MLTRKLHQHEQDHGVDEMIEHRFFPDAGHSILREQLFQPVRAERTKRDREESHHSGNAAGQGLIHRPSVDLEMAARKSIYSLANM